MLVKCTECNITYKLDDSLIENTGSKVRCSQCKHIFTIFPDDSESLEDQQKIEPEKNAIENKIDDKFQDVFDNDSFDEFLTAFCPDEFPFIARKQFQTG